MKNCEVLDWEEGIEKDVTTFIAEVVFDKLSSNIREYIRNAILANNDIINGSANCWHPDDHLW
mgnify:CR=1 FL=1